MMKSWQDLQAALPEANRRLSVSYNVWYNNGSGWFELDHTQGTLSQADALAAARHLTPFGYVQVAVEVGGDPNRGNKT